MAFNGFWLGTTLGAPWLHFDQDINIVPHRSPPPQRLAVMSAEGRLQRLSDEGRVIRMRAEDRRIE